MSGEIAEEFAQRREEDKDVEELIKLVDEIVPYDMTHNAEHEACDLLLEVEKLEKVIAYCDSHNYSRVCLYLTQCANYATEPDDTNILKVVFEIYKKFNKRFDALRIAIKLNDSEQIRNVFQSCETK